EKGQVVLVPRDKTGKPAAKETEIVRVVGAMLNDVQKNLFERAKKFLEENISEAETIEEFNKQLAQRPGFIKIFWCGKQECEDVIREKTKTTPRCIPLDETDKGKCIICGERTETIVYYARAY
ncbi:MAG: proline--tRNA ligase, partial [candidate division WOR-3 bacterium]